jgi:hypothetical protein
MPFDGTKNEIRLLRILPNLMMDEGAQCSLFIASLDDNSKHQNTKHSLIHGVMEEITRDFLK